MVANFKINQYMAHVDVPKDHFCQVLYPFDYIQGNLSYYIFEHLPPPWGLTLFEARAKCGVQGPKNFQANRISSPDHRGRLRQVPGGPEPEHPQGLIFRDSCFNQSCQV